MRWIPVVGLALLLVVGAPHPARAQSPDLDRAQRNLENGELEEARYLVAAWWEANPGSAPRGAQELAIWLRALLTIDPELAERDFRRLVLEFPGGRYADESLMRLALLSLARDDAESARRHLEILVRDYPQSPLRLDAGARLNRLPAVVARAAPVETPAIRREDAMAEPSRPAREEVAPVPIPADPPPASTPPVSTAPADPAPTDSTLVEPSVEDDERFPMLPFAIQLGAFSTLERANDLATRARNSGYDVRVVQVEGSALVRVRMGEFPTRPEAEEVARALRAMGFEAVVSSDREREGEVR